MHDNLRSRLFFIKYQQIDVTHKQHKAKAIVAPVEELIQTFARKILIYFYFSQMRMLEELHGEKFCCMKCCNCNL